MNREGIIESKWKTRGSLEGQSSEDTLQVVLSIKVFLYEEDGGSGGARRYKGF